MCTYPSHSNKVLQGKNALMTWLIIVTPTLKYM